MTIAHVASGSSTTAGATTNTATTASINTTGANLLVGGVSDYSARAALTDSKANSWTGLTLRAQSGNAGSRLYYSTNSPTVGSSHTATAAATNSYPQVVLSGFSGAHATAPFDQQNGAVSGSSGTTTLAAGSVTPSENNELLYSMAGGATTGSHTQPSGYTEVADQPGDVNSQGIGAAYLIQTTATANNPSWTLTNNSTYLTVAVATFKAAGSGTFTATAALMAGGVSFDATATFMPPVFTGTADVDLPAASLLASATATSPTFSGAAALVVGALAIDATGTFSPPVYSADVDAQIGSAVFAASGSFATSLFTASAALLAGSVTFDSAVEFDVPIYAATAALVSGSTEFAASGDVTGIAVTATADLAVGSITFDSEATFYEAGDAGYNIYRRPTLGGTDQFITFVGSAITELELSGFSANDEFYFHVKAVTDCGVEDDENIRLKRVAFDAAGNLIPALPNAPTGLKLECGAGGAITASWRYIALREEVAPAAFNVYIAQDGAAFDFDTPAFTVSYATTQILSQALGTFSHGTHVRVAVRAESAAGDEEQNNMIATAVADAEAPDPASGLEVEVTAS